MKKKFYKILSLLLTIIMVVSMGVITDITAFAQTATYYVAKTGSDTAAGTSAAPLKTISGVVKKAIAAGLSSGDTVTAMLPAFSPVDWGEYIEYDFNLVIKTKKSLGRYNVSIPEGTVFGGNVAFENVVIKDAKNIYFNGKSVTFDENTLIESEAFYFGGASAETVTTQGQTVDISASFANKTITLSDESNVCRTYDGDFNFVLSNAVANPKVNLAASGSKTVYNNNLNINVKDAVSVEFIKASGSVEIAGAVQLITNEATLVSESSINALKGLNATGGFYCITNSTRIDDFIKITETAGKYKVDTTRYTVTATAADGSKVTAKNGYLVLPKAGEYDVTVVKVVEKQTYYVSSKGKSTNSGLSKSSPLRTIGDAIDAANKAGYWENDTITVRILSKTIEWGAQYTGSDSGSDTKIVDRRKQKYGYDFSLIVRSDDTASRATISIPNLAPMMGDIKFDYVNISKMESFVCYDDNVTMTKNVKFTPGDISLGYRRKSNTVAEKMNLTLNNQFNGYIQLTNSLYAGKTFNEDVTVTVNNSKSTPRFLFVLYWRGTTTFNGNLNINVAKAKSVSFGGHHLYKNEATGQGEGKIVANKAVQIIVNSKTQMDSASISNLDALGKETKLYLISNNSGIPDLLEFTETAGKFKVKSNYVVTAVNSKGKATVSKNGYLKLKKTGNYSVTAQVDTTGTCKSGHKYSNDCDAMCNVCEATRTVKHKFKYSCSRACQTCGIKRVRYHSIAVRVIPATDKKDGENQDICDVCYTVLASEKIERIKGIKLSQKSFTYDGEVKTPEVIMVDTAGEELVEKVDYTLTYPKGRINVGTYKIKIKFKGEFKGTKYITFDIKPPKTSVSSISADKKSLKVTFKKKTIQVTGYQVQYSTSKKFTSAKSKTVSNNKTTSATLKSLKAKTTYYVRVRTYKTVNGKKYYSNWSAYKSKKTK